MSTARSRTRPIGRNAWRRGGGGRGGPAAAPPIVPRRAGAGVRHPRCATQPPVTTQSIELGGVAAARPSRYRLFGSYRLLLAALVLLSHCGFYLPAPNPI